MVKLKEFRNSSNRRNPPTNLNLEGLIQNTDEKDSSGRFNLCSSLPLMNIRLEPKVLCSVVRSRERELYIKEGTLTEEKGILDRKYLSGKRLQYLNL